MLFCVFKAKWERLFFWAILYIQQEQQSKFHAPNA